MKIYFIILPLPPILCLFDSFNKAKLVFQSDYLTYIGRLSTVSN